MELGVAVRETPAQEGREIHSETLPQGWNTHQWQGTGLGLISGTERNEVSQRPSDESGYAS